LFYIHIDIERGHGKFPTRIRKSPLSSPGYTCLDAGPFPSPGIQHRQPSHMAINSLRGNYSATSNNMKLDCMAGPQPALLAVPNVTAHPLAASVPITALLYNGSLLCGFNVGIKGLRTRQIFVGHIFRTIMTSIT